MRTIQWRKVAALVSVILLVVRDEGGTVMKAMALVLPLDEQDTNKMSNDNILMLVITQIVDTFCTTLIMEDLICILLLQQDCLFCDWWTRRI